MRQLVLAVALFAALVSDALTAEGTYRLAPGDLIEFVSYEREGPIFRLRVSRDGIVFVPYLGPVPVGGLTTEEAGKRITARLGEYVPGAGALALQVVEHAQVFLIGDVETPGGYSFRPGMVAVELLALGGGIRRGSEEREPVATIHLEREIAELRLQRLAYRAVLTRIAAEESNATFRAEDVATDPFVEADVQARLFKAEEAVYAARAAYRDASKRSLEAQKAGFETEVRTLERSIALHDDEVALIEEENAKVGDLVRQGLAVQPRLLGVQRELSALRRDALDLRLSLARARQAQLQVDQRISELVADRRSENASEAGRIELSLARTQQALAAAVAAVSEMRSRNWGASDNVALRVLYSLIRERDGERVEQPVGELDEIWPGDVLRVQRIRAPVQSRVDGPAARG